VNSAEVVIGQRIALLICMTFHFLWHGLYCAKISTDMVDDDDDYYYIWALVS